MSLLLERPREVLRVATYNTADFTRSRDAAAQVVRDLAPDVLCLQEVPRRCFPTTVSALFAARCELFAGGPVQGSGGTVVLTGPRVRALRHGMGRLPVPLGVRRRGYAAALVGLSWLPASAGQLVVVSVHLSLTGWQRVQHMRQVLDELQVDESGLSRGRPVLIAGDFNEAADAPARRLLSERLTQVDGGVLTFPSDTPQHPVDAVYATPGLDVLGVGSSGLPREVLTSASDHLPLWIDLRLS